MTIEATKQGAKDEDTATDVYTDKEKQKYWSCLGWPAEVYHAPERACILAF